MIATQRGRRSRPRSRTAAGRGSVPAGSSMKGRDGERTSHDMLADPLGGTGSAGEAGGLTTAAQQNDAKGLQVLASGVGIAQHRLEVVVALVVGSREHQAIP